MALICIKVWLQRFDAARLERRFIHPARIEVRRLGDVAASRRGCRSEAVDDALHVVLGFLAQRIEGAVARLVFRHLERREPRAVGIFEEVVARLHGRVSIGEIDAEFADRGFRRSSRRRCRLARRARRKQGGRGSGKKKFHSHGEHLWRWPSPAFAAVGTICPRARTRVNEIYRITISSA
jgi:hypothetical protein